MGSLRRVEQAGWLAEGLAGQQSPLMFKCSEREVCSGQNKAEMASVSTCEHVGEDTQLLAVPTHKKPKGLGRDVTRVSRMYPGW